MKKEPQSGGKPRLTANILRKALHDPQTALEIAGLFTPMAVMRSGARCIYTLADVERMLGAMKDFPGDAKAFEAWGKTVFGLLGSRYVLPTEGPALDASRCVMGYAAPTDDPTMAWRLFDALRSTLLLTGEFRREDIRIDRMLRDLDRYRKGQPIQVWRWTISSCLTVYDQPAEVLEAFTPQEKADARAELEQLALQEEHPIALNTLAYACYGGNPLFPCDWERAEECLLRLMASKRVSDRRKCGYANTLGYIYYYGRCTDGVPDWERAFRYFSLGAAGGWYESVYKLADLYLAGRGVPQNRYAAAHLIGQVYQDCEHVIAGGNFDCKFADAALRMGNLCRDGIIEGDAAYYYSAADYAIRKRLPAGYYGDRKVFRAIRRELEKLGAPQPKAGSFRVESPLLPPSLLRLMNGYSAEVRITQQKRSLKIAVKRLPHPHEEKPELFFDFEPGLGYCELTDRITFTAMGAAADDLADGKVFIADEVRIAESGADTVAIQFVCRRCVCYEFEAASYVRTIKCSPQEEPQE